MQESNLVETLSVIPITSSINKKRFWNLKPEYLNNVKYGYVLSINFPVIRNVIVFFHAFFKILFWKLDFDNANKIVICDILKRSIVAGAFFGCKIRRIKIIGIVTDIPGISIHKVNFKIMMAIYLARLFLPRFDGYILITIQMNSIVNPKLKPYIVMECLVDKDMAKITNQVETKDQEKIILYAGGLYEQYGIKTLIEAFKKLDNKNIKLDIYGTGPMGKEMPIYMDQDSRIRYYGVVSNEIVVEKQLKATLLVNPRRSTQEYTKYSFPIKNIEYMASGTPTVTTHLPGMPDEYIPFVYIFNDETSEGIYYTLKELLSKNSSELHSFGSKAKDFILAHKNNFEQGRRITIFIDHVLRF
jgi:glycosyltransferase involved in cell wall biosynthesis